MKINANDYDPEEVIKIIREWTELTQKEFAESIGLSERNIQYLESGERTINFKNFINIIKKHGITVTLEKK